LNFALYDKHVGLFFRIAMQSGKAATKSEMTRAKAQRAPRKTNS
jgi:hypothetical protein